MVGEGGTAKSNFADTTSSLSSRTSESISRAMPESGVARRAFLREHTGARVPYFSDNFRELFKHHRASANHEQRPI